MTIDTTSINKYAKGFQMLYKKGSRLSEHVYLDLQNRYLIMQNPASSIIMRCPIEIEDYGDTEINNFFVSMPQFFSLCDEYGTLEITPDKTFISPNDEKFTIANYEDEDFELPQDFDATELQSISENDLGFLFEASEFVNETGSQGVILYDDALVGTDRVTLFEHKGLSKDYEKVNIPLQALSLIKTVFASEVSVGVADSIYLILSFDNEFEALFPIIDTDLPQDYYEGNIISRGFHDTNIILEKSCLLETLKFLTPFVKNIVNERLKIVVRDNQFVVFTDDEHQAERKIDLDKNDYSPELEDFVFTVSRNYFVKSLKNIHDDFIVLFAKPASQEEDSNAGIFGLQGKDDSSTKIVMVRLPD